MKRKIAWMTALSLAAGISAAQILQTGIPVCKDKGQQGWIQAGYNVMDNEYLVVWEDYRNFSAPVYDVNVFGRILDGEGRPKGSTFPVCNSESQQAWPHLDFDPITGRYLVAFEDYRNKDSNADVYACLLDDRGRKVWTDSCGTDTCFAVSRNAEAAYAPMVAYNSKAHAFLAVWGGIGFTGSHTVYGEIVTGQGAMTPVDIRSNLVIVQDQMFQVSNPDVTCIPETNEWLVVYGIQSGEHSYIYGQRVAADGSLVKLDGTPGMEGMCISTYSTIGPDAMQPRVQSNSETIPGPIFFERAPGYAEALAVWNRQTAPNQPSDIWGQRIAFITHADAVARHLQGAPAVAGRWVMVYVDSLGHPSAAKPTNFLISGARDNQRNTEIAYSRTDSEYLVVWGDFRNEASAKSDMYGQRIAIESDSSIAFLDADRKSQTNPNDNIPLVTTAAFEGNWNINGCVHNTVRNQFLAAYTFSNNTTVMDSSDVEGVLVGGTAVPSAVEEKIRPLEDFELQQNFPNPFNSRTEIRYRLPVKASVSLRIFDVLGREIAVLERNAAKDPGTHSIIWNGRDGSRIDATSGVYIARLDASGFRKSVKIVLTK